MPYISQGQVMILFNRCMLVAYMLISRRKRLSQLEEFRMLDDASCTHGGLCHLTRLSRTQLSRGLNDLYTSTANVDDQRCRCAPASHFLMSSNRQFPCAKT